jgi:predicted RNA polymerase sigma factor
LNKFQSDQEVLPHLFRQEYAKITAVLCFHFGLEHIEIAEDIASDTFLKASEYWAIHGIPEHPKAWLYTVARNKTKDYFKNIAVFENKVKDVIKQQETEAVPDLEFNSQMIEDSQLAMIFAVCNPANPTAAQISLALQILCGFSVEEIANAFLTKSETIKKRLHRARINLRDDNFRIESLSKAAVVARLDTVLKTLYLLFNEGYFSKSNNQLIRTELCSEAVRLTLILIEGPFSDDSQVNALMALMCFQSSRLNARTGENGDAILFDKQNQNLWDQSLIDRGNYYFAKACYGTEISKYHLEAGIAYWHTIPAEDHKWQHILQLYDQLLIIEYSPVTALNRAFAFAKIHGDQKAIREIEKMDLVESNYYHELLGYLYASVDISRAIQHYTAAIGLTKSKSAQKVLKQEIDRLLIQCADG